MSRFVKPLVTRLPISGGDSIDVKQRLNAGESHQMYAAMLPTFVRGEKPQMDTRAAITAKVLAYLVGWSLMDDGRVVPYSPEMSEPDRLSTLNGLDSETFKEITEAIDAHEEEQERARYERKNAQAGESGSSPISASPDPSDGITTGSTT